MEHSNYAFEIAANGQVDEAKAPAPCPVLSEFTTLASTVVEDASQIASRSTCRATLALAWARLALLIDYVVRICLPEIFKECGRLDCARYFANLPQFGLGSQVGLYYCALKRSLKGAYNRYLEPVLAKIGELAELLRREATCKPIPAGTVANLWHFMDLRGGVQDVRCLLKRVACLGNPLSAI